MEATSRQTIFKAMGADEMGLGQLMFKSKEASRRDGHRTVRKSMMVRKLRDQSISSKESSLYYVLLQGQQKREVTPEFGNTEVLVTLTHSDNRMVGMKAW